MKLQKKSQTPAEKIRLNKSSPFYDKTNLMRLNKFIAKPYVSIIIAVSFFLFFFFLGNYALNLCEVLLKGIAGLFKSDSAFTFENLFKFQHFTNFNHSFLGYIVYAVIISIFDGVFLFKLRTANKDFNVGQKGSQRWTTLQELQEQYLAIPEKKEKWEGAGGFPIARYKDKIFVDTDATHNLIFGTTRSGKGELYVLPMIDINSRATVQSSMVITDIKQELVAMCKGILEKRGYDFYCFNLIDPTKGMGYNPLTAIVVKYKESDINGAQLMARSFAYSIFCNDTSNMEDSEKQFWSNTATDLLTAHIIALIEDCLRLDREENNKNEYIFFCKQKLFAEMPTEAQQKLRLEIEQRKAKAKDKYNILTEPAIPDDLIFKQQRTHEKEINMFSIYNIFSNLASTVIDENGRTALDNFFMSRPLFDKARLFYSTINVSGYRTKTSIYATMISKLSIFAGGNIAKMTAKSSLDIRNIGFGDKPVAIFICIPEYDKSNHFLATTFLRQIYYVLSEEAVHADNRKCKRPVRFILDEIGNFPVIENIKNWATLGAGRNMFLNLFFQSYSQLDELYEKAAGTIKDNCHNKVYIKTDDEESAKKFSADLGNETITNINRIGKKLSVDKTFTETYEERPLLNPNELMDLLEGEVVIKRTMHRTDLSGNDIRPFPIFCTGKTKMKYRYQYLSDDFPDNILWSDISNENQSDINPQERAFDMIDFYQTNVKNEKTKFTLGKIPHLTDFTKMLLSDDICIPQAQFSKPVGEFFSTISCEKIPQERKTKYIEFLNAELAEIQSAYKTINL